MAERGRGISSLKNPYEEERMVSGVGDGGFHSVSESQPGHVL